MSEWQNYSSITSSSEAVTDNPGYRKIPEYLGFICCFISCLLFGSYFVVVKKYDAKDGVFFQWIQCSAIMTFGVFFYLVTGMPTFEPLAIIGGAMWATGNVTCVIIVRCVGLGVGMGLWTLVNMILGWASSRFGWFGDESIPSIPWLQYLGIVFCVVRGIASALIVPTHTDKPIESSTKGDFESGADSALVAISRKKRESIDSRKRGYSEISGRRRTASSSVDHNNPENRPLFTADQIAESIEEDERQPIVPKGDFVDRLPLKQKRILGVSLAVFCGVLLGFQYCTINLRKADGGSQSDMDYSFPFYCGIFVASTIYTIIYAVAKRNRPQVNEQLIAPAFLSGIMWVVAQTAWFIATESLSLAITFPIMSAGPSLMSLLWGYFVFHELQGRNNTILFVFVIITTLVGVLMVSFSR